MRFVMKTCREESFLWHWTPVGMHPSVLQVMNADWRVDEESQCNEKGRRKRRKKVVMKEARAIQEKEGAKEEKEVDHWVERAMLDEKVVARMLMSLSQPLSKQMDTEGIKKENGDAISQDKFAVPSDSKIDEPGRKTLKFTIKRGTSEAKRQVFDMQAVKEEKHNPQLLLPMIGGSSTSFSIGDQDNGRQRRNSKPSNEFDKGKSKIEVKESSKLKLTGGRVRSKRLEELKEAEANLSSDNIKLKKNLELLKTDLNDLKMINIDLKNKQKCMKSQPPGTHTPEIAALSPPSIALPSTASSNAIAASSPARAIDAPDLSIALPSTPTSNTLATASPVRAIGVLDPPNSVFRVPDLNLMPEL